MARLGRTLHFALLRRRGLGSERTNALLATQCKHTTLGYALEVRSATKPNQAKRPSGSWIKVREPHTSCVAEQRNAQLSEGVGPTLMRKQ
jgi:hypothetical protein